MTDPDLQVRIEVPPMLAQRLTEARWRGQLGDAIAEEIAHLARELGLPGRVTTTVATAGVARARALHGFRIWAGALPSRFAQDQVARVYALMRGRVLAAVPESEIEAWLSEDAGAAHFVALLAREAIARNPSELLGTAQVENLTAALGLSGVPPPRVKRILRQVVALGVSLDGLHGRADLLAQFADTARGDDEVAESLIAALKPATLDILLAPDTLRRLMLGAAHDDGGKFALLRDGIFYEAGLRVPDLRIVEEPNLPPHCFAFRVNAATGLPWVGLGDNEWLVNTAAETYGAGARSAVNPVNGASFAIVSGAAPSPQLQAWTPLEYLALCLSTELRKLAPRLIDRVCTERELERFGSDFPVLERCARGHYSMDRITRVLRELAAQSMPLRNLRLVLTSLLEFDTVVTDPAAYIVVDDRVPVTEALAGPAPTDLLVEAVRRAHKHWITHKLSGGSWSLSALLLDPALEREVLRMESGATPSQRADWGDRVLDAIAAVAPAWGAAQRPPCLLTTGEVAVPLRRLVAQELPHLPVVSYQDLAPDSNISVAERIRVSPSRDVGSTEQVPA